MRGVVQKAEKQAVLHIDQEHAKGRRKVPTRVSAAQRDAAELETMAAQKHVNPAQDIIIVQRKRVQHDFGTVARALATCDTNDKSLAAEVVHFVKQMPPIKTRQNEQVEAMQRAKAQQGGQGVEQTRQMVDSSSNQGKPVDKGRSR